MRSWTVGRPGRTGSSRAEVRIRLQRFLGTLIRQRSGRSRKSRRTDRYDLADSYGINKSECRDTCGHGRGGVVA